MGNYILLLTIGKSLDTSLDIYIRGDFNKWLFDESNSWVKDSDYKMIYNPDTKDYDVGWFGAAEYRKSEVELDASYYIENNNFKIPDSL